MKNNYEIVKPIIIGAISMWMLANKKYKFPNVRTGKRKSKNYKGKGDE